MSDVKGLTATAVAAGGLSNKLLSGLIDGRVKCMLDTYTIAGTETAASTITLGGKIPTGANIIAIVLYVSANQTSATFDVGDLESTTRYASASTSLQTAGSYVYGGTNYVVDMTTAATPDNQIVLTTAAATLSAATLQIAVLYSID